MGWGLINLDRRSKTEKKAFVVRSIAGFQGWISGEEDPISYEASLTGPLLTRFHVADHLTRIVSAFFAELGTSRKVGRLDSGPVSGLPSQQESTLLHLWGNGATPRRVVVVH